MRDVVVIGSDGQLGQCVQSFGEEWTYLTPEQLELKDPDNVRMFFSSEKPKVILNLAAYTAVDKAEDETDIAMAINSESSGALAESCQHYFYISTDYVFNGRSDKAYKVDDTTDPINAYGRSKKLGEEAGFEANPNTTVVRTSWLYSEFGNNFVKSMLRLGKERDELNIVNDQVGSPTYAKDLAAVLIQMVNEVEKHPPGVYHYSNSGQCSWYDFAKAIFNEMNMDVRVKPIPTSDYPTPAKRPHWSVLDCSKIKAELNLEIPKWENSLKKCLKALSTD